MAGAQQARLARALWKTGRGFHIQEAARPHKLGEDAGIGTLELVFNDETFKTETLADTAKALRIQLSNTDVTIGSDLHPSLTIDLAKVKFSKFVRKYGNGDVVTAAVDFKAFYSVGDTSMITATLQNTQSSY